MRLTIGGKQHHLTIWRKKANANVNDAAWSYIPEINISIAKVAYFVTSVQKNG